MRKYLSTVFIIFMIPILHAQSVNHPLDHWAYEFLERMETKGVLHSIRDGSLPFTRQKIAEFTRQIDRACRENPGLFSKVEIKILERLKGEFWDELKRDSIQIRPSEREPHFYSWEGESGHFHMDLLTGGEIVQRNREAGSSERRIHSMHYGGILRGALWGLGIYSDNRIFAEWGSRKYIQHYRPSEGYPQNAEKDSSRATWDVSDSYLKFGLKGFQFQFGRDNLQWGPAYFGGLMLSGLASSIDLVKMTTEFGSASFTWIHGELRSDFNHKWISAHRLEFSAGSHFDIGLSESVIYGNRGLELAYLNPVIPYLVVQHSLGDRDNMSLGFDVDVHRIRNLKLYGEVFIDDLFAPWDVFSNYWGNKLAFTAGMYWIDPIGVDNTGFRCEYTRIEPYVYTHEDSVNVYEHYNFGIGHFLEPNSDGLFMQGEYRLNLDWGTKMRFYLIRHGLGDRRTAHQEEDGDKKHFLSGVVEQKKRIGIVAFWEIVRDVRFEVEAARMWIRNQENRSGNSHSWDELNLTIRMNW